MPMISRGMALRPPLDPANAAEAEPAVDPVIASRFARAGRLCAIAAAATGGVVLGGWLSGATALENIGLGGETMKVNTSLAVLAGTVSLAALAAPGRRSRRVAVAAALLVALVGAANLCEYLFGIDLGIDQALFHDAAGVTNPGRMAPNTALALTLFGAAVLLFQRQVGRVWPRNPLAVVVLAVGFIALIGHVLGASSLSGIGSAARMSAPAALAVALLGLALLLSRPTRGALRLLSSEGPGGALARRLLPAAIAVPPAVGLLCRGGRELGLYGTQVELLLTILLMAGALSTLAWMLAREVDRKGAVRAGAIAELQRSEERFRNTFENATVGMALENLQGAVIDANPALCEMLGYSAQELNGKAFAEFTHPDDVERDLGHMRAMLVGTADTYRTEKRYFHADGREVWAILSVSLARGGDGAPLHFIAQMQDISARKRSEERFAYLAFHDELTDLPNRTMFEDHLEKAMARARRRDRALAVLYVDLDGFKMINDSLGHSSGDAVLCEIAVRLRRAVRAEDLVARHSGDEFLVLLADVERCGDRAPGSDGSDLPPPVAAAIRQLRQVLREPFAVGGEDFALDASIGVSVFPDDAEDAEELVQHADTAMSEGKQAAAGLSRRYSRTGSDPGGRLALTSHLRRAVKHGEFVLHYQPIVALAPALEEVESAGSFSLAEHAVMAEALIRWEDPEQGLVAPDEFIPLAEHSGLIEPIGEWVVEEVSRQSCRWAELGIDLTIAFNLSPRQMRQPTVMRRLLDQILALGADPERMVVELTESVAVESPAHTQLQFREARAGGLRSAVDDFGAGYSSLGRLLEIHPDFIKIDRALTEGIPTNAGAMAIVKAAIGICRGLAATPILEGIETDEQWRFAVAEGCTLGQGFRLGRPQSAEQLTPKTLVPAQLGRGATA